MGSKPIDIQYNCRHFKGYIPCFPHKEHGVECSYECSYLEPTEGDILIIKLAARGDVIRTTPIITKCKQTYPSARIFWLTKFSDVLPSNVDVPMEFTLENITCLRSTSFDIGINLDKEPEACALMEQLTIKKKHGFGLKNGVPAPLNTSATHKFLTGISDQLSKENKKHYLEEIFKICGWEYNEEEYLLPEAESNSVIDKFIPSKKVIGLNTGCGYRWITRIWPEEYWIELSKKLRNSGYLVLLLGGPEEHEKNRRISDQTGADYLGVFPIREFLGLMEKCDVVVTAVTMAMHFAIGLKIPLILFNNIFNPNEFHFFAPSKILSPDRTCDCYYRPTCVHGESCMKDLHVGTVFEAIQSLDSQ